LKALVTGATGFIGSHLVEALLREGVEVRCLVRRKSNLRWIQGLNVDLVYGDCVDRYSLSDAVKGIDHVFHLAGLTKAIREEDYFKVNGYGTENLIHACLVNNSSIKKFIYLSSQAAAGPCFNGGKKKESDTCCPVSPYGRSKRMGEEFLIEHFEDIPIIILRPSAVYGPRDRDFYVFFKILKKGINPCIFNSQQYISLCYVEDIISALLLASNFETTQGEIFFLSDGNEYKLDEIGKIFAEAMEIKVYHIHIPEWVVYGIASFSEIISKFLGKPPLLNSGKLNEMVQKNWVCDITKARNILGFRPRFTLREGVRLTYQWYCQENWL